MMRMGHVPGTLATGWRSKLISTQRTLPPTSARIDYSSRIQTFLAESIEVDEPRTDSRPWIAV